MSTPNSLTSFFGDRNPAPPPPVPSAPALTPQEAALVAEACSKSGVLWVRPLDDGRHRLAWHVWHDDAVHLVHGVGEQLLPLLSGPVEVMVASKDTGARLVTFLASAQVLPPHTPPWEAAAAALAAARLNAQHPAEQLDRWARTGYVVRITPLQVLVAGAVDDAPSQAAVPPPNPGTTGGLRPWHLGGRSRRARRRGQLG